MINTGRSRMLDSGFFENQVWGALHKAWKGYTIAKNKDEFDKMLHYADIIQECQYDLRLEITSFDDIGKSAPAFHSMRTAQTMHDNIPNKNNDYSNNNYQEQSGEEENYPGDSQFENDRFTDKYSEDYQDD